MDLPEILQWISAGRKTGTLHLERRSIQKRIIFRDGVIHTSWSNDPRESLGQYLIRDRRLSEEQLFKALLKQEEQGIPIGSVVVSEGLLGEDELRDTLEAKAEESIYDVFLWPEGTFQFKDGEFPDDMAVFLDLEVQSVILEGIRRVDEWRRIRQVFPSPATVFKAVPESPLPEGPEREALAMAGAGKSLAEISLELRRSEFEAASLLFGLHKRGLLTVDPSADEKEEEKRNPDPVGTIKELLALAYQRLQERRYEGAVEAYQEVLVLDRLNQHAKKGLLAATDARARARAHRTIPLDKVPVLSMDYVALTRENFDPQEGFVLSRINGQWDVQSILKLCPMTAEEALLIFARLLERKVIEMR